MHPLHSLVPPAATAPAPAAAASVTPPTATSRRVALSALRSLGVATLWGCGGGGESTSTDASPSIRSSKANSEKPYPRETGSPRCASGCNPRYRRSLTALARPA